MEGAAARARFEGERDLALAHTIATFTRAKKLEPLKRYLPVKATVTKPAPGAMRAALDRIVAATAGLDGSAEA